MVILRYSHLETHQISLVSYHPWGYKEIKPVNPKGNQPRTLIGWTDAEAEARIIWPHDEKSQLTGKDPYAGKDWGQEEKRMSEGEMVAWYYRLSRHEFLQTRRRLWRTGKPGVLQSMRLQTVAYDWATEQQQQQFNFDIDKTEYNTGRLIEMCLILNCSNNK